MQETGRYWKGIERDDRREGRDDVMDDEERKKSG
jgi:hypothetical protein